jgi:hypothetical protein
VPTAVGKAEKMDFARAVSMDSAAVEKTAERMDYTTVRKTARPRENEKAAWTGTKTACSSARHSESAWVVGWALAMD